MFKGRSILLKIGLTCTIVAILLTLVLFSSLAHGVGQYKRWYFKHWSDMDSNGLNTRHEALLLQSLSRNNLHYVALDPKGEKVISGLWVCPYTGEVVTDPAVLDIDHVVPLKYAWEHGAYGWDDKKREIFANDLDNLLVVRDYINQAKGDKSPAEWLPPNISYAREYSAKFLFVCTKYILDCDTRAILQMLDYVKNKERGITSQSIMETVNAGR